jgi:hypothetical protein
VATEHVAFTRAGLCRFRAEQEDIHPPVCILKLPSGKGTRLDAKYTLGTRSAVGTFWASAVPGEMTVAGQKYKAVKVDAWTGEMRGPPRSTVWYGFGVGPVRQTIQESKSRLLELDLERFEKSTGK